VDVDHVVDGFDFIAVADTERLVGRLDGELVPAARVALLEQVQALEPGLELRVRLRLLPAAHRWARAGPGRQAPVDDRPGVRVRTGAGVELTRELGLGRIA